MSTLVKGGIWKNSEDEILKAAVMKYGLNQWSRIASLLVRKTPAQCKARWVEWLDPSIKKIEWSREEDEKLLHLAKIFPSQWRTIAPVVGRTAHQCQERYERLLDEAQGRDGMDDTDPRRLRPGEIDPAPETKPAKADPVDMEDDEQAMLQEARARLANVRGKKAKRKAREKMMEETRRLGQLQKEREMRAAGLSVSQSIIRKGEVDYNKEVPFETAPMRGVHEYGTEEDPKPNLSLQQLTVQKLENRNRQADKEEAKSDMKKLLKRRMDSAFEEPEDDTSAIFRKSTKLILPDAQEDDDDDQSEDDEYDEYSAPGKRIKESLDFSTSQTKLKASNLLSQLPSIVNEIEINVPEYVEDAEYSDYLPDDVPTGEQVETERGRVSQVVRRSLPRSFNMSIPDEGSPGEILVRKEAVGLWVRDALDFPNKLMTRPNRSLIPLAADRSEFFLEEIKNAEAFIETLNHQDFLLEYTVPLPVKPSAEQLQKQFEAITNARNEIRNRVFEKMGESEKISIQFDDEIRLVSEKIADVQRRIRARQFVEPKREAENQTLLEGMLEKVKAEKSKNKHLQDRYMRLASFVKKMTNNLSA